MMGFGRLIGGSNPICCLDIEEHTVSHHVQLGIEGCTLVLNFASRPPLFRIWINVPSSWLSTG